MIRQKKIIFLVRHGTTASNEADLLQGRTNNTLNEKGDWEVRRLSERLKDETIDVIFSSPLQRARQTAEAVNHNHQAAIEILEPLSEIDLGAWEGQNYTKVQETEQNFHEKWLLDPELPVPGGESFLQVMTRARSALDRILLTPHTHILIVAHATINRAILAILLDMNPQSSRFFRSANASLSKFRLYENSQGSWGAVDFWNDTSHLQVER